MKAEYTNRHTVGQRLNLTMLAHQEPPLIPPRGYKEPKEVQVKVFSSAFVVPTSQQQVRTQKVKDEVAKAQMRWDARWKRVAQMKEITSRQVADLLGITIGAAAHACARWVLEGKLDDKGQDAKNRCKVYVVRR